MSFISYAQNFEDVMLWRALKHVENGFYIDIGAQDPLVDSVSLAFYEHGWRGVHVEPTSQYARKLRAARPDETVMQVAIGNGADTLTFFEFNDTGLSTGDPVIAQRHKQNGFACNQTVVSMMSMDTLLDKFGEHPIHWLKLDVEGLEKCVLDSWQLAPARPWILVIESMLPSTQIARHVEWENLVLLKGYDFAYFDGLNRFYVLKEQANLKQAFDCGPNIFDGFTLSGLASHPFYAAVAAKTHHAEAQAKVANERTARAEAQVKVANERTAHAEAQAQQASERATHAEAQAQQASDRAASAEAQAQQAKAALFAMHRSSSWRLTAPLRIIGRQMKILYQLPKTANSKTKEKIKLLLAHVKLYINRRPTLRRVALNVLVRFPSLARRIRRVTIAASPAQRPLPPVATKLGNLTPRARHIYGDLTAAIENHSKESS